MKQEHIAPEMPREPSVKREPSSDEAANAALAEWAPPPESEETKPDVHDDDEADEETLVEVSSYLTLKMIRNLPIGYQIHLSSRDIQEAFTTSIDVKCELKEEP